MTFSQRISKELSQSMKKLGFSKKGNRFFKIENDIAFCVDIETPSVLVYVQVYIMPLYIHSDYRYYTYGNRLNNICRNVSVVSSKCDEDEFREWIAAVIEAIQRYIIPFFDRIHSPDALLSFLADENPEHRRFIFCMPIHRKLLKAHTLVYLRKYTEAEQLCKELLEDFTNCTFFTKNVIDNHSQEIQGLLEVNRLQEDAFIQYLTGVIANMSHTYFRRK